MIRHNILIAYRNSKKYKSSFFINLAGLSSGLACVLLIFFWVSDELKVDQFHKNKDRLYQVLENVDQGTGLITRMSTSGPTAEALAAEMPEVEMSVTSTLDWADTDVLSTDDKDVKAVGLYAGVNFFRMFSYELIEGEPAQVLADKKSIVLNESLARNLFGTIDDVVGKIVLLRHDKEFQVSGIMKDIGTNSSARFEFVLSFEGFRDENEWVTNWFNTAPQTHVLLKERTDITAFNNKIKDLVRTKTEGKANHRSPFVRRHSDGYLYGRYENGMLAGGRIEYVKLFSIIAIFILLIACINFMNLSTARASRRVKEVGVKKAIGARQRHLVFQYLSESIFIAFISLGVSLLIVWLLLPQFNVITGKQLTLQIDLTVALALVSVVLFTGILAGSYPALYLSRFNPSSVLRGKISGLTGEVWARKGLVVFQFALSIILIVSVWVVFEQIRFIQTRNLGYNKDNIVILEREGVVFQKQEAFLNEVRKIPGVTAASCSGHDLTGHNGGTYGVEWTGKNPDDRTEFERFAVDFGMIELLDVTIKEGRSFSKEFGDEKRTIIFNEAGIEFMDMKDPIGKTIKLWGEDREIVGVVKDFNFETFHEKVKPLFFFLVPENAGNVMIKIQSGEEQETLKRLENFYTSFNPGFPFTYRFVDDDYQTLYTAERRVATLSRYFAGLAILISCLGLFGLAAFTAERRMKEIGIRKIMGSSTQSIVYLLSTEFSVMVLSSIIIALPTSYFITSYWLRGFEFRIDLQWWIFATSAIAALLIAWLTVAIQTIKAARVNPTECLRSE